jgi:hypothetical protein
MFNNALRVNNYKGHASIIKRVSYAYCIIEKSVVYPILSGSFNNPMSFALLMMDYSSSTTKTIKRGIDDPLARHLFYDEIPFHEFHI